MKMVCKADRSYGVKGTEMETEMDENWTPRQSGSLQGVGGLRELWVGFLRWRWLG